MMRWLGEEPVCCKTELLLSGHQNNEEYNKLLEELKPCTFCLSLLLSHTLVIYMEKASKG